MSEVERILSAELNEDQRDLLAAMLAAVARADGRVDAHEVAFLKSFLGDRVAEDGDGGLRAPVLPEDGEIRRRGAAVADPLYLACSLMMCADEEADARERELLRRLGGALAMDEAHREGLDRMARQAILDQAAFALKAFEGEGVDRRQAFHEVAKRVGASADETEALCESFGLGPSA